MDIKVSVTKTGREWKNMGTGLDCLDDNKTYEMVFHVDSIWNVIRLRYDIFRKKHFTFLWEES